MSEDCRTQRGSLDFLSVEVVRVITPDLRIETFRMSWSTWARVHEDINPDLDVMVTIRNSDFMVLDIINAPERRPALAERLMREACATRFGEKANSDTLVFCQRAVDQALKDHSLPGQFRLYYDAYVPGLMRGDPDVRLLQWMTSEGLAGT